MLRHTALAPTAFGQLWRQGVMATLASGLLLTLAFGGFLTLTSNRIPIALIWATAISELLCTPLIALCSLAFQAHERLGWSLALPAIAAFLRLLATFVFVLLNHNPDASQYAPYCAIAALISVFTAVIAVSIVLRPPPRILRWSRSEATEGFAFSTLSFTGTATTELDKSLALRFGGAELAGIYSASYRFVSVLLMPAVSLIMAIQPRLLRGGEGNRKLLRYAIVTTAAYSVAAVLAMQAFAVVLPLLLGSDYESSVHTARVLALVVPLYSMRQLATTQLTAQGKLRRRILIECAGLVAMFVLADLLVPRYGLNGAVTATLASESLVAVLAWIAIRIS